MMRALFGSLIIGCFLFLLQWLAHFVMHGGLLTEKRVRHSGRLAFGISGPFPRCFCLVVVEERMIEVDNFLCFTALWGLLFTGISECSSWDQRAALLGRDRNAERHGTC